MPRRMLAAALCGLILFGGTASPPASAAEPPAQRSGTSPSPPPPPPASQVAWEIVEACRDHRYSDVGTMLHPTLRRTWISIGYTVRQYCDLITRNDSLSEIRIQKEDRAGSHTIVYLTYVFRDGSEKADRAGFLQDRGIWKLAN